MNMMVGTLYDTIITSWSTPPPFDSDSTSIYHYNDDLTEAATFAFSTIQGAADWGDAYEPSSATAYTYRYKLIYHSSGPDESWTTAYYPYYFSL